MRSLTIADVHMGSILGCVPRAVTNADHMISYEGMCRIVVSCRRLCVDKEHMHNYIPLFNPRYIQPNVFPVGSRVFDMIQSWSTEVNNNGQPV